MIKIQNISKRYFDNTVIDNVSLDLPEGQFITLLGPNGAGKSTLLRMMAGNELPDKGNVLYKGTSLGRFNFPHVNEIGFVHEKIEYISHCSVEKFVERLKCDQKFWDQKYFDYLVDKRKLDISKNYKTYSRGQKMQIALIINLAMRPKVLLLDEITSVVDVYGRKFFLDELRKFVDQKNTVIITTNIVNELEYYTDHLIIIKNSKVQLNLPVENVGVEFKKLRKLHDQRHPVFEDEKCVWAGVNSDHSVSYIIESSVAKKYNINDEFYDRRQSTLEDVFIYYFTKRDENEKSI